MSHSNENEPTVLDHNYDGIQEYDNPLPSWWLATFFITIIFGFLYWIDAEFANRPTQAEEAKTDLAIIQARTPVGPTGGADEEEFKHMAAVASNLTVGKQTYISKCAACHGQDGQGMIGPNLTDEYWLHGSGGFVDLAKVIRQGVLDKGMPNWEAQLNAQEINSVTIYIASLQGSQPPNPKSPQGEKVKR